MNLSRTSLFVALLALPLTIAAGADAARRHHPPCQKHGSDTVANTRHVRVYSVSNSDGGDNLYGCLRSNNRRQLLVQSSDDGYVSSSLYDQVKIAGRFVAWQVTDTDDSCKAACPPDYDSTTASLYVRDLKRRKTQYVAGEVDGKLVLTRGGALAWTQDGDDGAVDVNGFDARGQRQLDTGAIAPLSLSVRGNSVSWKKDGERFSAELAPRV